MSTGWAAGGQKQGVALLHLGIQPVTRRTKRKPSGALRVLCDTASEEENVSHIRAHKLTPGRRRGCITAARRLVVSTRPLRRHRPPLGDSHAEQYQMSPTAARPPPRTWSNQRHRPPPFAAAAAAARVRRRRRRRPPPARYSLDGMSATCRRIQANYAAISVAITLPPHDTFHFVGRAPGRRVGKPETRRGARAGRVI